MNRERLKALRDHLAGLPDERVLMKYFFSRGGIQHPSNDATEADILKDCGTAACVAGWAAHIFPKKRRTKSQADDVASAALGLSEEQASNLFWPPCMEKQSRLDAIAAIDSMLANPSDDALPVWPEKAVSA